jgi:lipoprotein NlpD
MIRFLAPLFVLVSITACTQAPAPTVDRTPTAQARVAGAGEYVVKRGDTLYRIARENSMDHNELAAINGITDPTTLREGQILQLSRSGTPVAEAAPVATPIGVGSGVESRPLDGPAPVRAAGSLREPRGGKEPYSDEAHARLNSTTVAAQAAAPPAAPTTQPATPVASAPVTSPATTAQTAQVDGISWAWPSSARIQSPYNGTTNKGIDFAGRLGDPVLAAADGQVLYVGEALAGYGKLVIVKHGANHLSVYAHNNRILVKEGQSVKLGQKIAEMGSTGTSGVKLHFEIRKQGKPVDPMPFLPGR